jgi:hypothetical protein
LEDCVVGPFTEVLQVSKPKELHEALIQPSYQVGKYDPSVNKGANANTYTIVICG